MKKYLSLEDIEKATGEVLADKDIDTITVKFNDRFHPLRIEHIGEEFWKVVQDEDIYGI